jgi:hypothetical protein
MIKDSNGDEFTYMPLTLVEGAESPLVRVSVEIPSKGAFKATSDARARVLARRVGETMFVDLADNPIVYGAAQADGEFDLKIEAGSITGFEMITLNVGFFSASSAGWGFSECERRLFEVCGELVVINLIRQPPQITTDEQLS